MDEGDFPDAILDQIPSWVGWIAQDSDGAWWAYEHEPNMSDTGWYENEVGAQIKLAHSAPNSAWRMSLKKI